MIETHHCEAKIVSNRKQVSYGECFLQRASIVRRLLKKEVKVT